jgi:hypothetical protein
MSITVPSKKELTQLAPGEKAEIALDLYENGVKPALNHLVQAIQSHDIDFPAYTVRMPFPHKGDGVPALIEPESLLGGSAREYASEIIPLTTFIDDQDPRQSLRAPGLIAASEETLQLVAQVNRAKELFHEMVQQISDKAWERKQEMSKLIPCLSQMQAFRQITVLPIRPEKVSFTWSSNSPSMSTLTASQALQRISAMKEDVPPMDITRDRWLALCDEYARLIHSNNIPANEVLVFRRQAAPHPRVNLYLPDMERPLMKKASLPIFYPHTGPIPPINRLKVLDRSFRRAQRSDVKVETCALVEDIDLYRYLEKYRQMRDVA